MVCFLAGKILDVEVFVGIFSDMEYVRYAKALCNVMPNVHYAYIGMYDVDVLVFYVACYSFA